ncbi:Alcohol dehydrogenase [Penicillium digitatum PHI26]|uniref:Alcohol dehydrogenase n=2 Tax=Penicillium digitatum TaxID=36651 RepID=K9GPE9_PEND2|nr:Alcohol dehydrogenase [Penicillium digitatum Pd1]EKV16573.1 Alcohol dehydrogenase [Penicillium digitatum PHI26]EKV22060.1 Alcohol dehydrogenase [Penicillium digitatum Pd1]
MLSLSIPSYSKPSGYQLSELAKPEISDPKDVIIRVHAASINPIDVKKADGLLKFAMKDTEFVKCTEKYIALKPPSLSFEDAASIPLAAMTALQALGKYKGDLTEKTVFVPAGLSGTGLFACQLAKNVFHAGKVITTVSTSKVDKINDLLGEGTVDEIIDYTKIDPRKVIKSGSVDFLFDTVGSALEYLCLMNQKSGCIVSVATMPSGNQLQEYSLMDLPQQGGVPFALRMGLNAFDWVRKLRAWRYGVEYSYMFLESSGEDLDELRKYVEENKLRTVVGNSVELSDIEAVRSACQTVYSGKGGLGKLVVKVADS